MPFSAPPASMSLFATPGAARVAALLLSRACAPDAAHDECTLTVDVYGVHGATLDTRDGVLRVARHIAHEIVRAVPGVIGVLSADVRQACTLVSCDVRVLVARE